MGRRQDRLDTTDPPIILTAPEADLDADDLVRRAASLREHLRSEQAATEERSYYSEETHAAFTAAGLYRVLQPRRFGGYELDLETFYRVVMELSRGCPSTGWCFCLGAAHVIQVATFFSDAAQKEIFGEDGHFIAAARDLPAGTATRVHGGVLIEGTWNYCSGAPYSTHFIARARVADDPNGAGDEARFVLVIIPRAGWTMLDDWHGVLGLRGSGSHSIVVPGTVVPAHFVVEADPFNPDAVADLWDPGPYENPVYCGRQLNVFHGELASVMVGAAQAALDEFERIICTSQTYDPLPPGRRRDAVDYQRPFGLALAMAGAARNTVLGVARDHAARAREARHGIPYGLKDDLLLESIHGQAGQLAFDAIELLARMSGSSNAIKSGRRMERYLRDALTYRSHQQGASIEMMATKLAQAHLAGLDFD